jgi:two-component system sensor histidine kinase KdpD
VSDADQRPDPDALLRAAAQEGAGRLKVFLGAAPGVGKTYEMLTEAAARCRAGIDVIIGVVETHGRAETEALVHGLEIVPRRPVDYHGRTIAEMDLDAILARDAPIGSGRRACPHQCAGQPARQALPGH